MEPSPSTEAQVAAEEAELLLDVAETTLVTALVGRRPSPPLLGALPPRLAEPGGVFVTLTVDGRLNGCIGLLDGDEPLGHAVARLALSAAFADPRLPALRPADFAGLTIEISLLSPLESVAAGSRSQLRAHLEPGHHGAVVASGSRQGLFLPAVWEQLPEPDDFLDHLWHKAGLTPRTWPRDLQAWRFTAARHERRAGSGRAAA